MRSPRETPFPWLLLAVVVFVTGFIWLAIANGSPT